MTGTVYAQHVDAVNVSASLFPMLGIPAKIGRTYTAEEELAGSKVAVLSDSLWRGHSAEIRTRSVEASP